MACERPIILKDHLTTVPCRRCIFCLQEKRDNWTFRVGQEYKKARTAYFITLTYDDQHLPIDNKGRAYLDKKQLVGFLKRLRIRNEREIEKYWRARENSTPMPKMAKTKYFACGEYGSKKKRPHYHIIVFNLFPNTLKYLNELWTEGNIDLKIAKAGAIHYTSGYLLKQTAVIKDGHARQFIIASQHMGEHYLKNAMYHSENLTAKCSINGFSIGLPSNFRNKIFTKEQKEIMRNENEKKRLEKDTIWIDQKTKENIDFDKYQTEQKNLLRENANKKTSKKRKL
ncbi:MAG: replication initiator protein [Microviridae sp.]|nr:MAG: replication initiator protein [Microviridae sp.]